MSSQCNKDKDGNTVALWSCDRAALQKKNDNQAVTLKFYQDEGVKEVVELQSRITQAIEDLTYVVTSSDIKYTKAKAKDAITILKGESDAS